MDDLLSYFVDAPIIPVSSVVAEVTRINQSAFLDKEMKVGPKGDAHWFEEFFGVVQSFYPDIKFKKTEKEVDLSAMNSQVEQRIRAKSW